MQKVGHVKNYFDTDVADYFCNRLLREINWETVLWGKNRKPLPRLVFRYSLNYPTSFTKVEILDEISNIVSIKENKNIIGIFCNYYRNGEDYLPYHQDNYNCDIISLSFGSSRDFYFKNIQTKERTHFKLENGDFIYFPEEINKIYQHGIPLRKKIKDYRINITMFIEK